MKFLNQGSRLTGFAVPLLSVRTRHGACGEFSDIVRLAELAKSWKMSLLQLLPVNDTGTQTSPYSALSAFALNPVYLDIGSLPEAAGAEPWAVSVRKAAGDLAARHRDSKKVAYEEILLAKRKILEDLWESISSGHQRDALLKDIDDWVRLNPWVRIYACFIALRTLYADKAWWEWPHHSEPEPGLIDALWSDPGMAIKLRYHAWVQMACSVQFERACTAAAGLGVDIMGDIPILMNADSADIWFDRGIFDTAKSAGAPPDMYSAMGQNWGFPLYRWDELERRNYSFWKERLAVANRYYSAYRIDHVLGFFRIWAIPKFEEDGFLGHFVPEFTVSYPELDALGFDSARIRWLSQPHVPSQAIDRALSGFADKARERIAAAAFRQIGSEDLFLFDPAVRGMADLRTILKSAPGATEEAVGKAMEQLSQWWRNRTLLEVSPGKFVYTWSHSGTRAWETLSEREKSLLDALMSRRKAESQVLWERLGRKILSAISEGVEMIPCAEDLGAVPPCVPAVLGALGIPGLRVLRWHRSWDKAGTPYVPFDAYPRESVACTSVHDSTNLRQWWEEEADRNSLWTMVCEALGIGPSAAPAELDPDSALLLLRGFAAAASRILVFPIQDLLAASPALRENRPQDERINVPGTSGGSNWLYRVKPELEALLADEWLSGRIRTILR